MATVSPGGLLAPEAGASRPRAAVRPPRRHRHRGWLLLVAVVLALFCVGDVPDASRPPTGSSPALRLPVLGEPKPIDTADRTLEDIGDPFVLPVVGGVNGDPRPAYVVYWTTDWRANVPTAVSTDLVHWQRIDDALPTLPSWAAVVHPPARWSAPPGVSTMTWGPTVTPTAGGWLMYYSTRSAAAGVQCLGVGFSASATGPFVDSSSAPLVCRPDLGGDIDPSVLTTTTGQRALVWKNDGNSAGVPVGIWEQPLTPDGRAVTGSPLRLIVADEPW
jgi:beta-xylosidase